jgi:transposase-like protein
MGIGTEKQRLTDAEKRERVADLYRYETNMARIARRLDLDYNRVRDIVRELDREEFERLRNAPDEEKGWQVRILRTIVQKTMQGVEQGRVLRDEAGRPLTDEAGRPVVVPRNTREYRTAILALADMRRIEGLDAPTRSINLDIKANAQVDGDFLARVISTEKGRAALLALEEAANEAGDVPAPAPPDVTAGRGADAG